MTAALASGLCRSSSDGMSRTIRRRVVDPRPIAAPGGPTLPLDSRILRRTSQLCSVCAGDVTEQSSSSAADRGRALDGKHDGSNVGARRGAAGMRRLAGRDPSAGAGAARELEPDGNGGFDLSGDSKVYQVDATGQIQTVLDDLAAPGGLQLSDSTLFFLTRQDGKLWQLDTATGQLTSSTFLAGNGLLRLPDGDLLTTCVGTEGGPSKGLSRYFHDHRLGPPGRVDRAEFGAYRPERRRIGPLRHRLRRSPAPPGTSCRRGAFPGTEQLTQNCLLVDRRSRRPVHTQPYTGAQCANLTPG